jgi:HEAT repeat protein
MDLELSRINLKSTNSDVVIAALKVIGSNGGLTDLQTLMSFIKHPNLSVKQAAVNATSALIKENLITHFHEFNVQTREKLGTILQSLDPSVVNDIGDDLFAESEERRLRAVQILGLLKKNPQLRNILAKLIHNRDVKIRATAVNILSRVIGPNDHDILLSLLNDKDKRVRANTIEALENLNNKRLVPILLRFRKDVNNRIRGNVLKALYNLGFLEIDQDVMEMINNSDNDMKSSALWVLSKIKLKNNIIEDAVAQCLLSDHDRVLVNARNALNSFGTPRASGYLRYLYINDDHKILK